MQSNAIRLEWSFWMKSHKDVLWLAFAASTKSSLAKTASQFYVERFWLISMLSIGFSAFSCFQSSVSVNRLVLFSCFWAFASSKKSKYNQFVDERNADNKLHKNNRVRIYNSVKISRILVESNLKFNILLRQNQIEWYFNRSNNIQATRQKSKIPNPEKNREKLCSKS